MKIKIFSDTSKIGLVLTGLPEKVVKQATARSANRAATSVRAQAARKIKEKYNLPIGGSSKGGRGLNPPGIKPNLLIQRARYSRGKSLGEIYASILVSDKPISLIHFVRGNKYPRPQKGIAIKRRKKIKIAIQRGKTITLKKDFILNASGSVQLYRRREGNTLHKQAIPSFYKLVMKREIKNGVELFGQERFKAEMQNNLKFYLGQLKP